MHNQALEFPYVAFDTETTGLEPGSRLVEIASILTDAEGNEVARFDQLVNPGMPLPPDVSAIHGLTDADLADAKPTAEVLRLWLEWFHQHQATAVFGVAHSAPYDVGILSWELGRAGLPLPGIGIIDTCEMAKSIKATKNNRLQTLVDHYAIARLGAAHRARSDADACRQYFNIARKLTQPLARPWTAAHAYTAALPAALAKLPELVATGGTFSFGYVDKAGARTDRSITPYGWGLTATGIEFHGLCHLRNERRTFKADGIAA